MLTSFGYTIDANIFWKRESAPLFVRVHNFFNQAYYFPGLDVELRRISLSQENDGPKLALALGIWDQPKNQDFFTKVGELGARASVHVEKPVFKTWSAYVEVESKTTGWVPGNVYLDSNTSMRVGMASASVL